MADVFWTEEKIARLKEMHASGDYSMSEICLSIGAASRHAVIGKIHRLGLAPNSRTIPARVVGSHTPKAKRVYLPAGVTAQRRAPPKLPPTIAPGTEAVLTLPKANEPLSTSRLLSLFDLPAFGMCRWPLGDPQQTGFAFCGADCASTRVYCPAHHQLSMPRVKPAEKQAA